MAAGSNLQFDFEWRTSLAVVLLLPLLLALGAWQLQRADEKRELLETFNQYREGYIPLIVPLTLIKHYVRKYDQPYLKQQVYLNPHPVELKLRNHA